LFKRRIEVDISVDYPRPLDFTFIEILVCRIEHVIELFEINPAILVSISECNKASDVTFRHSNIKDNKRLFKFSMRKDPIFVSITAFKELF